MQDTKSKKLNIPKVNNLEVSITVPPKTVSVILTLVLPVQFFQDFF